MHQPLAGGSTAENICISFAKTANSPRLSKNSRSLPDPPGDHGGGNNSTFTTRVVTSSGSDTYSVVAAALSSLKGPKHGGANIKVVEMMRDIEAHVSDWTDEDAVRVYLNKILNKEAFDGKGLIYGMGHAVYSLSDPRARYLRASWRSWQ